MNLDPFWQSVLTGAFAAGGAYAAIRMELRWLRRDVDRLMRRCMPTAPLPLDEQSARSHLKVCR